MEINKLVITIMDFVVALIFVTVLLGSIAFVPQILKAGNIMAMFAAAIPLLATVFACSIWCVLSGIYANTCKAKE